VTSYCEHENENSDFINVGNFFTEQLSAYQFLKEDFAQ
jgi:hypothetical protein